MKRKILIITLNTILYISSLALEVYDPANHQENITQRIESVKQTLEAIKQTQNQIEQLKNDAINLASIDGILANSQLIGLQQSFQSILDIQNKAKSQINDFKNFQEQFKNIYISFEDLKNLNPEQYIYQADKILEQTRNIAEDSLRTVGITNSQQMQNDAQRVRALMSAANTVQGQKAAIQANVQMTGMTYQVLNDMKLLLSQSLATQGTAMMKEIQKEQVAREEYNTLTTGKIDTSNKSSGLRDLLEGKNIK
ncbi:conjugal transfer protein TrbJ [Fusobacterium necrogenes]|uniref:Conjugal transfer protein TrbJ n=1 Tax=Fusobacterium necrogenes TaxID=858 RepID=A0A377GP27_9FUSO|nr:hypothetical protein [Fusobacterium necrogenes]STO28729.1 conjugal transfer protein TrbJ [Fusobacterium necrogenes]